MQKFEDVAMSMKANFENIELVNQTHSYEFDLLEKSKPNHIFSDEAVDYLNELSKTLIKDPRAKSYPDVVTFAFYCRKANLISLKEKIQKSDRIQIGRGVAFHIAPSNVPVNFAYSLLAGILSGNANIVKIPSGDFDQVGIIVDAINCLSEGSKYKHITNKVILVKYDRSNNDATKFLSSICNVRVIWGGDESIARIRRHALPARAFDVTFADRYSLCVINADSYILESNPSKVAEGFYNDTYLFDQNACTSPHLLVWLGSKQNIERSKFTFWEALHKLVQEKYVLQPVQAVGKLVEFYNQSLNMKEIERAKGSDNSLWRIELKKLDENIEKFRCSGGYFNEYHAKCISEVASIVNTKYQTMSYYGLSKRELMDFINQEKPRGIDRITPIGKTMDFSLNWDGYDLIHTLSRVVEIN